MVLVRLFIKPFQMLKQANMWCSIKQHCKRKLFILARVISTLRNMSCTAKPYQAPILFIKFHVFFCYVFLSSFSPSEAAAELHSWTKLPRTASQLTAIAWRCKCLRQPTGCTHHGVCLWPDKSRRGTVKPRHRIVLSFFFFIHLFHFAFKTRAILYFVFTGLSSEFCQWHKLFI